MNRVIYKLDFKTGVHFGNGSLSDTVSTFQADTLFSALCIEAVRMGGDEKINKFVDYVKENKIKFSDSFPYIDNMFFIPKPFKPLEIKKESDGNSKEKKAYKKLKYLPIDELENYFKGELDVININKEIAKLGINEERNVVAVRKNKDSEPYHIGIYKFSDNAGLYIIAEFENDVCKKEFDELFKSLSYTGIGGKVSSGLGKFSIIEEKIPKELNKKIENAKKAKQKMTLSICLPKDDELDSVLENAHYRVEKRSGFVSSETYSDSAIRKKDFYAIEAGACFEKAFEGSIVDVSINGKHPVYRYAKPLFMEV